MHWFLLTLHWRAAGFGNHLLLQRLYEVAAEDVDAVGEKAVGMFGPEAVSPLATMGDAHVFAAPHVLRAAGDELRCAESMEVALLDLIRDAHDELLASGSLTLGLGDLLPAIANRHEQSVYLLGRAAA